MFQLQHPSNQKVLPAYFFWYSLIGKRLPINANIQMFLLVEGKFVNLKKVKYQFRLFQNYLKYEKEILKGEYLPNISMFEIYFAKYSFKRTNPSFSHAFLADLQLLTSNSTKSQLSQLCRKTLARIFFF